MAWRKLPRQLVAVAMGGLLLGGCTSAVVQTPTLSKSADYEPTFDDSDTRHSLNKKYFLHPLPLDIDAYVQRATGWNVKNPWNQPWFRDYVQNDMMRRSDQICSAYVTRLVHGFTVGNAAVQSTQSVVNLLKVISAPADIVGTALQTATGNITGYASNDVLQHQQFVAVNKRILDSRRVLRNQIRAIQISKKTTADYSLSQAVYDAELYHSYCNYATRLVQGEAAFTKETETLLPAAQPADKPNLPGT